MQPSSSLSVHQSDFVQSVKRVTYLLYLAAASAAAVDDSEMMASQEAAAPAHMPCHHDLAPVNGITFHDFLKT